MERYVDRRLLEIATAGIVEKIERQLDAPFDSPYDAGYDCGKNGANLRNCHWTFFSTPALTSAWEWGKKDALAETPTTHST